jgi:hypothetical protein
MGIPVDSSKLITCQKRRGGGGGHDLCFLVIKKKSMQKCWKIPIVLITSWEVTYQKKEKLPLGKLICQDT